MSRDYAQRAAQNDASRNKASHHTEPWTEEELTNLRELWDGTDETLATIAELLGRTIEACRQRYYSKSASGEKSEEVVEVGWIIDNCDGCGECTDVYQSRDRVRKCEECRDG